MSDARNTASDRIADLLATCGINDPTGTLRIVIECELARNPNATTDDIRAIWDDATEDARVERERENEAERVVSVDFGDAPA